MELTEVGITYSFKEQKNYRHFKCMLVFQGKEVYIINVWIDGWHYEFLQLLAHWNRHIDEWKYIEVFTW